MTGRRPTAVAVAGQHVDRLLLVAHLPLLALVAVHLSPLADRSGGVATAVLVSLSAMPVVRSVRLLRSRPATRTPEEVPQ